MNFVIIMIFMTIMFLTSSAESDRKIGWTIVGIVFFLYLLGTIGPVVWIILGIIVVFGLIWLFSSDTSSNNNSNYRGYLDSKPSHPENYKPINTKKESNVVDNIKPANDIKTENKEKSVENVSVTTITTTNIRPEAKNIDENVSDDEVVIAPAHTIPVEEKHIASYHEEKISKPEKEIRHEEKKVRTNKTAAAKSKKKSSEYVEDNQFTEKITLQDSVVPKGLAIGEMEWTHIEKGVEAEDSVQPKEYFASIKEAVEEYSIPDEYVSVMIERNSDGTLAECPALIWKDNFFLNVLPMIKKSTVSCWPLRKFESVTYKVIADANPDATYNEIGKQEIANEFEDKFPEYMFDGRYGTYTTTFVFSEGLEITNTSAKEMFELLNPKFVVEDEVMMSSEYEPETKEIYKKHILWLNGVIDASQYNDEKERYISELKNRANDKLSKQMSFINGF